MNTIVIKQAKQMISQQQNQMKESDWGRLLQLQDQIVRQEDHRKQQRQNYHKILYKNQLERMIDQRRQLQKNNELTQKIKYNQLIKNEESKQETARRMELGMKVKESSQYNLETARERRERLRRQEEAEKTKLRQKFRKIETEGSLEKEKELHERVNKRKQLAKCYEQQISNHESKKYLEIMQNHKFQQLAHELEQRKKQSQNNHISHIKYGYSQNPQTYEILQNIYAKKLQAKSTFLKKIQTSRTREEQLAEEKQRERIQMMTLETSKFNKSNFQQKQFRKKQLILKQSEEQHNKLVSIEHQMTEEQESDRIRKQMRKKQLKTQLEHQITESQDNRYKWKRMSQNQSKINNVYLSEQKPVAMIPGLYKDYKDIRKENIIDQFLKMPPSVLPFGSKSQYFKI